VSGEHAPEGEVSLPPDIADAFTQFCVTRSAGDEGTASLYSKTHGGAAGDGTMATSTDASEGNEALNMLLNANGLGLGLPLCRRLTVHMGGDIGLADVPGFTRWWAVLPVGAAETPRAAAVDTSDVAVDVDGGDAESKAAPTPVDFAGLHVIAVDDEAVLRRLMQRFLSKVGVRATLLSDGLELEAAIDDASKAGDAPVCVLLDVVMLRSDGADVCRALRRQGVQVPIYAMTGNADNASVFKYRQWGFNGVLAKPFTDEDVAAVIEHAARGGTPWLSSMDKSMVLASARALGMMRPRPADRHAGADAEPRRGAADRNDDTAEGAGRPEVATVETAGADAAATSGRSVG